MKDEIRSAVDFLSNILRSGDVDAEHIFNFNATLQNLLKQRYENHWFPEKPFKGSGFRCLRINHKIDPILLQAADAAGLPHTSVRTLLPKELTMWVDPQEVSYRFGENGSIGVLFDAVKPQSSSPDSTSTSSSSSCDSESDSDMCSTSPPSDIDMYSSCKNQMFHVSGVASENIQQLAAFVYS